MSTSNKSHREWLPETEALYSRLEAEEGWSQSRSTKTDTQTKHAYSRVETKNGPVIHFAFFLHDEKIRGVCQFGEDASGFIKGTVHGGAIATILDDTVGVLATNMGTRKMYTVYLNVTFKRPTPMRAAVLMEATIDRVEGHKMFLKGILKSPDERTIYSKCTALYIDAEKPPGSKMEDVKCTRVMSSTDKSHQEWLPETETLYAKLQSEKGLIYSKSNKTDTQMKYLYSRVETRNGPVIHFALFLHHGGKARGLCQFGEDASSLIRGTVHGGAVATMHDTITAVLATKMGTKKMYTVFLNVIFKRPTPVRAAVLMEATIDRVEGHKMFLKGFLKSPDEKTIYSECSALFIDVEKPPSSNM